MKFNYYDLTRELSVVKTIRCVATGVLPIGKSLESEEN